MYARHYPGTLSISCYTMPEPSSEVTHPFSPGLPAGASRKADMEERILNYPARITRSYRSVFSMKVIFTGIPHIWIVDVSFTGS